MSRSSAQFADAKTSSANEKSTSKNGASQHHTITMDNSKSGDVVITKADYNLSDDMKVVVNNLDFFRTKNTTNLIQRPYNRKISSRNQLSLLFGEMAKSFSSFSNVRDAIGRDMISKLGFETENDDDFREQIKTFYDREPSEAQISLHYGYSNGLEGVFYFKLKYHVDVSCLGGTIYLFIDMLAFFMEGSQEDLKRKVEYFKSQRETSDKI